MKAEKRIIGGVIGAVVLALAAILFVQAQASDIVIVVVEKYWTYKVRYTETYSTSIVQCRLVGKTTLCIPVQQFHTRTLCEFESTGSYYPPSPPLDECDKEYEDRRDNVTYRAVYRIEESATRYDDPVRDSVWPCLVNGQTAMAKKNMFGIVFGIECRDSR